MHIIYILEVMGNIDYYSIIMVSLWVEICWVECCIYYKLLVYLYTVSTIYNVHNASDLAYLTLYTPYPILLLF